MLYESYSVDGTVAELLNTNHLHRVKWLGDDKMVVVRNDWLYVLNGMDNEERPSDKALCTVFYEEVCQSIELKEDIAYFNRLDKNHEDHHINIY